MNYSDDFYEVKQLRPNNKDTVFYNIKRKQDGIYLDLHITNTVYQVIELNKDIEKFMSEQIEFGKDFIELMNSNYEIIISSADIESNFLEPLNEKQLKLKVENR